MFQSKAQAFLIFIELTLINFSALTSSPFHLRFKAVPSPFQLLFRERTQSEGTAKGERKESEGKTDVIDGCNTLTKKK